MSYEIKVNSKKLQSEERILNGRTILNISDFNPPEDFDLYKKIKGKEFEPIQLDETVDLEEPGIEQFRVIPQKELLFDVDDETYKVKVLEMTPLEILKAANLTSEKFYLKQIMKHMEITYKNDENKSIEMLGHPKFISCTKEPATVS